MNRTDKTIAMAQLTSEQRTLKELEQVFKKASEDCAKKIAELSSRTDAENLQSIIYQKQYQEMVKKQIDDTLNNLQSKSYTTINDFLTDSYYNGYCGTMYSIANQGIPLTIPIDQKKVAEALQHGGSKISEPFYSLLGEDIKRLKNSVRAEVSRGIAEGASWNQVADRIAKGMNTPFTTAKFYAMRIARTEGHRVNQQAHLEACEKAKEKGADVLKQWCATLDDRTRETHQELDGQIVEVDEDFVIPSTHAHAPAPSMFGIAEEDINCRCTVLQRARWALDEDELETLKERAEYFGIDKTDSFEDFKDKYLDLPETADTDPIGHEYGHEESHVLEQPVESENETYTEQVERLERLNVAYNPVEDHSHPMTQEEIINALAGGDKTKGSCASLGLAYIGQEQGWDVLDFRNGESRFFFSQGLNLYDIAKMDGIVSTFYGDVAGKSSCTLASNFLKTCEVGKEYYLCVGRHASIVRLNESGVLQYLELQSSTRSGWTNFNGNPRYTLTQRFGCSSSSGHGERWDFMMNITDSNFNTDEFRSLLGFINTAESEQVKGFGGTIK